LIFPPADLVRTHELELLIIILSITYALVCWYFRLMPSRLPANAHERVLTGAIAAALERGITKNGGRILRRTHVEEVIVEDERAVGVRIRPRNLNPDAVTDDRTSRNPDIIRASKAVVSNCDLWNTFRLVPLGKAIKFDEERAQLERTVPLCKSFVHLHVGIDATGLPDDLPPQVIVLTRIRN
jgi:phytoene dehydrogenase-like protein